MDSYRNRVRELVRKGDYAEAFRMIRQDLESRSRESSMPEKRSWSLYFACVSLFGLGHIQQARKYYQQLLELSGDSVSVRYIRAYLELQSRKPDEALVTLTSILELDPSDVRCDALIEQIKEDPEALAEYGRKRAGILDFFPGIAPEKRKREGEDYESRQREGTGHASDGDHAYLFRSASESAGGPDYSDAGLSPIRFKGNRSAGKDANSASGSRLPRMVILSAAFVLLLFAVWAGYHFGPGRSEDPLMDSDLPRPPGHSAVLPSGAGDFAHFYDNKDAAVQDYEEARKAIEDGRVNQARKILGRLERSNIDFVFKERALSLRQSIGLPDMGDFRDSITLGEIENDPFSYRDAVFLWEAVVQKAEPSGTGMDLRVSLINRPDSLRLRYTGEDRQLVESLKSLQSGQKITVYGRVLSSDNQGSQMTFQLLDLRTR